MNLPSDRVLSPPYGSRPVVVGTIALAVAALGGLAWLLLARVEPEAPAARVIAAPRTVDAEASLVVEPATPPAGTAPAGERDPALVEVCGLGWVEVSADRSSPNSAILDQVPGLDASVESLLATLRASDDAFDRAAGVLLDGDGSRPGAGDPARVEALAQQAVTTDDARVYALAYHLCVRSPEQGSCARLSAAQWSHVDPGNAAPWLFVLDDAMKRNDGALADEALHRIGSAARFEDHPLALAGSVAAHAGTSPSDLVAAAGLSVLAAGTEAAFPVPLQRLTQACAAGRLGDANRRQLCDSVAATLGERSDSQSLAQIGATIGRRVGWPLDRIVRIRAQSVALAERASSVPGVDASAGGLPLGCDGMRAQLAQVRETAALGEPQAARAWMTASGKPCAAYAEGIRDLEARRIAAEADEARRGASAPLGAGSSPAR